MKEVGAFADLYPEPKNAAEYGAGLDEDRHLKRGEPTDRK